jgi:hypothetical protein
LRRRDGMPKGLWAFGRGSGSQGALAEEGDAPPIGSEVPVTLVGGGASGTMRGSAWDKGEGGGEESGNRTEQNHIS